MEARILTAVTKMTPKAKSNNRSESEHHPSREQNPKQREQYLTALAVRPPPRCAATSAQNELVLSKLTVLPMARRRRIRSDSLVQVNGIAHVKEQRSTVVKMMDLESHRER